MLAFEFIWHLISPQRIKLCTKLKIDPYLAQTRLEDQQDSRQMLISNVQIKRKTKKKFPTNTDNFKMDQL